MNDAIVFSFVTAIETHSEFYHRTERSILRGAWDDRFFYQVASNFWFLTHRGIKCRIGKGNKDTNWQRLAEAYSAGSLKAIFFQVHAEQFGLDHHIVAQWIS